MFSALTLRLLAVGSVMCLFAAHAAEVSPWTTRAVPGAWPKSESGQGWYRCWVKVPDRWTIMTGRPLFRESVTFSMDDVAGVHEVHVNGRLIGAAGKFPPKFERPAEGLRRYKVPPGLLLKGQWNEITVRVYNESGQGGFLRGAPSIQGYFLECVLGGEWEFQRGSYLPATAKSREAAPARAAFDQFREASRVLGEAAVLMPGSRLSPAESMAQMKTDEDLAIEQLLTEPVVAQPTHLGFDDRGRLWVSQYRQYPYPAGLEMISRDRFYRAKYDHEPPAPPNHHRGRSRISIHEDTDGDGRYDRHKVFLDGLDLANASLPDHDGVWVMHTPYLVFYPDADRDDVPDGDPVVHLSGFGFEDTHSVANGLVWGPDGWIYGGQGSTVASRIKVAGADDAPGIYFEGCMVWRYQPETRTFEIFAEGGGNVFGLEFDSDGRLFSGHNGGSTRGWHYVQGGYHLKQGRQVDKFGPPGNPFAFGELPMMRTDDEITRFSHNTIVCEGTAMPTRMRGNFLAADPLHNEVVRSERIRRGATFETRDLGRPLRADDKRFRPVYMTNAPDGSVLVADFYEEYIAHGQHYQSQIDPESGRVYRLRGKEMPLETKVDLRGMKTNALVALLDHPNKWHRQMAVRLLGKRGGEPGVKETLRKWILEHEGRAALDGLWALHQAGGFDDRVAEATLGHPYAPVRAWAVRLWGDRRELSEAAGGHLRALASREEDVEVWAQLASTARRLPPGQAVPIVGELLRRSGDLDDPYIPLLCWWVLEAHCDAGRADVMGLFRDPEIWKQAMAQREVLPRLMRRLALQGRERDLLDCAVLLRQAPGPEQRGRLMAGFEQAFAGGTLPHLPEELLAAIAESGAASLILRVRQGEEAALEEAMAIAADAKAKREQRLDHVKAFGEIESAAPLATLLELVRRNDDEELRRAALASLQRFSSPEIAPAVIAAYGSMTAGEKTAAQALLASRPGRSAAWLEAIDAGALPAEDVAPEAVAMLRRHAAPDLAGLVRKHFGEGEDVGRPTVERIAEVRAIVAEAPGSPYRGRPIFLQRCAACHVLFHDGGRVGPELTSYQRDDLDTMLTSILDPNAEIREGYEGVSVRMRDGRVVTGFVADHGVRTISLRGFDGSELALSREKVSGIDPLGRSLMPVGLLDGLRPQEMRDFFAYLRSSQPMMKD